jgi:hypothetical protein
LALAAFGWLAGFFGRDGCAEIGKREPKRFPNGGIRLAPAVNPGQLAVPEASEEKK